jgi:membrane associated rhomboid family serine protease
VRWARETIATRIGYHRAMFIFPYRDDNPHDIVPIVNWLLIGACVLVFLWQVSLPPGAEQNAVYGLGMIPAVLFGYAALDSELVLVPAWASVVTSMFMHGSLLHLIGNMLYLWIFGDNIEASLGRFRYLAFYLLCGVAAAMTQALQDPQSEIPMVGASGAIAGVLGAYLLLHPRANVRVLFVFFIIFRTINVPAAIVLGTWFALQLWQGATVATEQGGVAFWAHIGGFVTGIVLVLLLRRRGVPLFGGRRTPPFAVTQPPIVHRRGSVPEVRSGNWTLRR